MSAKPQPAWLLPLVGLAQVWVGTLLVSFLERPGASWTVGNVLLAAVVAGVGIAILALAVRNCVRLWQVPAREGSWATVGVLVVATLLSAAWATGPTTVGEWHWSSLVPGAFAAYSLVVLAREVFRRI